MYGVTIASGLPCLRWIYQSIRKTVRRRLSFKFLCDGDVSECGFECVDCRDMLVICIERERGERAAAAAQRNPVLEFILK